MKARATLALAVTTAGVVTLATHHKKAPTPGSALASVAPHGTVHLLREPVPSRRPAPVKASRRHTRAALRLVGTYADTTMYCSTGNQNAAGRWPQLGDVAVLDRRIPFGSRVYIDGNVYRVEDWIGTGSDFDIYGGSDAGCEQRALNYGRRHLRVVVER